MARACPNCKAETRPRDENPAFPFCSPKCKLVDLGRWLDGSYRVAAGEPPDEPDTDVRGGDGESHVA
jgi:endogenous inhibitor of DNA gyrase (YacG/DUF329 family)